MRRDTFAENMAADAAAAATMCRRCGLAPSSRVGDGLCDFCAGSVKDLT